MGNAEMLGRDGLTGTKSFPGAAPEPWGFAAVPD